MKKLYTLFAVALATLAMTSCFDDSGNETFFGGNQVEFADGKLPNGLTETYVRASLTQTDQADIMLNRVSTSATSAITVNVEVDPSSTAVEGVHYSLSGTTGTIAAGEFIGSFPVTILTGNIDPSETPDLVLNIASATGAEVSTNYGSITVGIRVVCPSDISMDTDTWSATATTRFGTDNATVTVTPLGAGQYVVSDISAGLYARFGFTTTQEVIYSDNCNALTYVASRQTEFNLQPPSVEPFVGTWDADTNTMTVYWSDPNNSINGTTVLVKN